MLQEENFSKTEKSLGATRGHPFGCGTSFLKLGEVLPFALGGILVVAGLAWPLTAIPGMPTWYAARAVVIGIVAEASLAIWLLAARG